MHAASAPHDAAVTTDPKRSPGGASAPDAMSAMGHNVDAVPIAWSTLSRTSARRRRMPGPRYISTGNDDGDIIDDDMGARLSISPDVTGEDDVSLRRSGGGGGEGPKGKL